MKNNEPGYMKIAVPTNDRISISNNIINAFYFKIFTVSVYGIIHEEFREKGQTSEASYASVKDCLTVLTLSHDTQFENYVASRNVECAITNKKIITNAIVNYVNELIYKESNITCSP